MARRIEPAAGWEDLVLPDKQKDALREIVAQVRHRALVYQTWGFAAKSSRGLGVTALFSGPSGVGKTLAAEVLALELRLDLFRIDLSSVVNKYIGETEKNLRRVFDEAEAAGAVLLFDEADALFGKRSEVKDSHDRHANIEVSYLLQHAWSRTPAWPFSPVISRKPSTRLFYADYGSPSCSPFLTWLSAPRFGGACCRRNCHSRGWTWANWPA